MRPFDLKLSMMAAMSPGVTVVDKAVARTPSPEPAPATVSRWRAWAARMWIVRPVRWAAGYLRRYMFASADRRLMAMQGQLAGLYQRFDDLTLLARRHYDLTLTGLEAAAVATRRNDAAIAGQTTMLQSVQTRLAEVDTRLERLGAHNIMAAEDLRGRTAAFAAAFEVFSTQVAQIIEEFRGRAAAADGHLASVRAENAHIMLKLDALPTPILDRLGEVAPRLDLLQQDLSKQTHQNLLELVRLAARVDALQGGLGPRLDEIEIKSRPLIDYDDHSYAMRLRDGYVLTAKAEKMLVVMVADATSEGLEPGVRRTLQRLIRPGMTVADVGANIGLLTLACARATGPSGRVLAFEPEPGPREQLLKMVALNGLHWVETRAAAVWRRSERLSFNVSRIIGHSSLYPLPEEEAASGDALTIEAVSLDDALGVGATLDVVKIDVEGAELDVLAGMSGLAACNRDIALIAEFGPSHLARTGVSADEWFGAFAAMGFRAYRIGAVDGMCEPTFPADVEHDLSVNIAFVRPGYQAEARLLKA